MLSWIGQAVSSIGSWLGSGISSFFSWLLSGFNVVLSKLIDAAGVLWDLLDSLWDFAMGFKDSILDLFSSFFPFVPPEVTFVFSMALVAVVVAGFYKKVRGN